MTIRALRDEPDIHEHTGFLLAEDDALKSYLTGIEVPGRDPDSPKEKVGVWFRWPQSERQIKYPFITIDAITAEPAYELFHSNHYQSNAGLYRPSVSPTIPSPPAGMDYQILNYLPFRLVYQVSVFTRHNLQDRYLRSIFATDVFPQRPFWIACGADDTWRRTELIGYANTDQSETSESGTKRIFRKVYTVSMMAEVPQTRFLDSLFYKVFRVLLKGGYTDLPQEYWTEGITTDYWEVVAGTPEGVSAAMSPGNYALHIYRGDTFALRLALWKDSQRTQPTDMAGATVKAQFRSAIEAPTATTIGTAIVMPNFVDLSLNAAATAALPVSGGVWDLEVTQGGSTRTVLKGDVIIEPDVTHG